MGATISNELQEPEEPSLDEIINGESEPDVIEDGDEIDDLLIGDVEENMQDIEIPSDIPKPETIKVRVDKVDFDGLVRTKDSVIEDMVKELYHVNNYEDLCLKSTNVRSKLAALGCFRSIEIFIDNSRGADATPNGVEVLYVVKELPLINYEVNTVFGQNNGTFNVVANVRNLLGRGDKILFKSTVGTIPMSNFTLSLSRPYPNVALQPTLNMHLIKETNIKHFAQRRALFDLALKANKRTHSLQLEGGDGNFLYNVLNTSSVHPINEFSTGTCIFAARHIVSAGDGDEGVQNMKGNVSKLISEISVMGRGTDRDAMVKNIVDMQRVFRFHRQLKLRTNGQCGVFHKLPLFDKGDGLDKNTLSRATTFFWQLGLDLCTPLPFLLTSERFRDFFRHNSLKPHFFIHTGGDGVISADQDLSTNVQSVTKNTQLSGGFGLKLRIGELANMELNYCIPLWSHSQSPDRIISPGLQFGLGWKFL